tara:strand:- start:195 stop:467 length:273 start_codon:yes stop_codon:yes gene_type:complete
VAVLPPDATFDDFVSYTESLRGPLEPVVLEDLWEWRQKLLTLRVDTRVGYRSQLPVDERHLSRRELGDKRYQEAKSQGRNIERLPEKAYF